MTPDRNLTAGIEEIARAVGEGTLGVAARNLATGTAVDLNAEEVFPSASVIKVAILVELFARAEEGRLRLAERVALREEDKVEGSGVLKELRPGLEFTLEELARLMIVVSDNTASNMLIDRVTPETVTARMRTLGLQRTVLGRRFYDFAARDRGLENWATPTDFAHLFTLLERRQVVSPDASEAMLAILRRQQFDSKIPRLLPPEVTVAHKTGTITGASHDAGILYTPAGPLVLAVFTKDLPAAGAEGAIRHVARLTYEAWGREGSDSSDA